jgi:hypothetical protein
VNPSPRFETNPHFDASVFGEKFDYFLAYSMWTQATKQQIRTAPDAFLRDSAAGGVFMATYLPANWRHLDYRGDKWYGTALEFAPDKAHGQSWLRVSRRKT